MDVFDVRNARFDEIESVEDADAALLQEVAELVEQYDRKQLNRLLDDPSDDLRFFYFIKTKYPERAHGRLSHKERKLLERMKELL